MALKRPLHVFVERDRQPTPKRWMAKIDGTEDPAPSIIFSPIYDPDLGDPLGQIDEWMPKDKLHEWLRTRMQLLGIEVDYVLVAPVGWYRDPDYNEN